LSPILRFAFSATNTDIQMTISATKTLYTSSVQEIAHFLINLQNPRDTFVPNVAENVKQMYQ